MIHRLIIIVCLAVALTQTPAMAQTITPSVYWKNQIAFPNDAFCSFASAGGSTWVKFTILLSPYDPNLIYFQNSKKYKLHYEFASNKDYGLDPFKGMSIQQFNEATGFETNQKAILGVVIFPPLRPQSQGAEVNECGIQFVRQDPFTKEQIRELFFQVRAAVTGPADLRVFYFPTFEQEAEAQADKAWFAAQGIEIGSSARWAKGNTCYSQGWALGTLRFFPADRIESAYWQGLLKPGDLLLTDGIPAEVPLVSGILSLAPATPNSHVAILAQTYAMPFVYLAVPVDANAALSLVDRRVLLSAYEDATGICQMRLMDTQGLIDEPLGAEILSLKQPKPFQITPMARRGAYGVPTEGLVPADVRYVGGKAANFGILRAAVPASSPKAMAMTFDLWNDFLDQAIPSVQRIELAPGQRILFWADEDTSQGPSHTGFKLNADGESVALFDTDGQTLLDVIHFDAQAKDVSYGRSADGGETWQSFKSPTPGKANASQPSPNRKGLVINEIMADNKKTIQDPDEKGQYPDWIELYNGSDRTIRLNGMYLTDDVNEPTQWRIPVDLAGGTLRDELRRRLSAYQTYPPADLQALARDLAAIRDLFTSQNVIPFGPGLQAAVLAALKDPNMGFDPNTMLRFRSSTNVEDSADYTGAGLYDSFSGCLADDLDADDTGPSLCDPNESSERGVFRAIRKTFASFYNDNAFLERLRRSVPESDVGMALVVHPSFPDDRELANGVATLSRPADPKQNTVISLVTQLGAVSVTNPEDGSIPEETPLLIKPDGTVLWPNWQISQGSSLVPLGAMVMTSRNDYLALGILLRAVDRQFGLSTGLTSYTLDLEYKKVAPGDPTLPAGGLVLKQVRQMPEPGASQVTPYLIRQAMDFELFTGEFRHTAATDVFAYHRLKSRWHLETLSMVMDAPHLSRTLYGQVTIEYLDEDRVRTVTESMPLLPMADHGFDEGKGEATDTWRWPDLANPRTYKLTTTGIVTSVSEAQNPFFLLEDLGTEAYTPYRVLTLDVTYDNPVTSWPQLPGPSGTLATTSSNLVYLWPRQEPSSSDVVEERAYTQGGISIQTSFYRPPLPPGLPSWLTSTRPLKRWGRTQIQGLTTEPIVLEGYYSQTYRPESHNKIEYFLFEPRLEPGISPAILEELRAKDIRFIYWALILAWPDVSAYEIVTSQIRTYGF